MKRTFRRLGAIAVGVAILVSASADASTRGPGISPGEAQRLRHQAQLYQQMKRHAGADGVITRAEQARLNHKAQSLRRMLQKAKSN